MDRVPPAFGPRCTRAVPRAVLLAGVSGVAIGASFSPHGGTLLPFLAFAPLGAALAAAVGPRGAVRAATAAVAPPGAAPTLAPFYQGFAAAAIGHGIGLYWMIPALTWRTGLALPAYLAVVCLIGMLGGAACQGAAALHRRWRWPLPVALAACWTGSEWVAAHVPGFSYAWLNAGMALGWNPGLATGSELLGARFLTFWTVAAGAWGGVACARWVAGSRDRLRITGRAVGALVLAVSPAVAGQARQTLLQAGSDDSWRVAAVQPGRDGGELGDWLEPLRAAGADEPFDFAAFPERFLASPPRGPGAALATFAQAVGSVVLVGAVDVEVAAGDTLWYNAAFLQSPGGGLSRAYRKVRLVPGLEGWGWWPGAASASGRGGYAAGRETLPLVFGGRRVGVMVCYDSAFAETARVLARDGAEWLAVLSNDDWLDPAREFRVTWAYWQHATHGRLRAIENRISLLQVSSTGYTFAVPPTGAAEPHALAPGSAGVAVLAATRRGGTTLFTLTGDLLGLACLAVFAAGLVAARGTGPRRIRPAMHPD